MERKIKCIIVFVVFILLLPNSFAQWKKLNGPYGESIGCINSCGTTLFAGGERLYKSIDNGANWSIVKNGFPDTAVMKIGVNGKSIFAATNLGVYYSNDGGNNWTPTGKEINKYSVSSFVFMDKNVFVATSGGMFISLNNGLNWNAINSGLNYTNITALTSLGTTLIAATSGPTSIGYINISTNNGNVWNLVKTSPMYRIVSAATYKSTIFLGSEEGEIYISNDTGKTWSIKGGGLNLMSYRINSFAFSGDSVFAATWNGAFVSSDNGNSWKQINNGLSSPQLTSIAVFGNNVFVGNIDAGIFRSADFGKSWSHSSNGMPFFKVLNLLIFQMRLYIIFFTGK